MGDAACQTGGVLLGIDEYPFHQVTDTFAAVAGSDPSWNDGHYVCAADQAGVVAMTSNVRLYANNDVLDGFVCVRHGDRQFNVRVSRRLRPDMERLGAGPLRLEILEPLRDGAADPRGQRRRHHPRRHVPQRQRRRTWDRSRCAAPTAG